MSGALAGKRIVNTRAAHQAGSLDALLAQAGAVPLPYPCLALAPPEDGAAFERALRAWLAGGFDWLVLTSANAVEALAERRASSVDAPTAAGRHAAAGDAAGRAPLTRVAVVGPATARAARERLGLGEAAMPEVFTAGALADSLPVAAGERVFLPQSELADPRLAERLAERGALVTAVAAYRPAMGSGGADLAGLLAAGGVDAVAFTSPSTVRHFVQRTAAEGIRRETLVRLPAACIGPETARVARTAGFAACLEASPHTLEGLVAALDDFFAKRGNIA